MVVPLAAGARIFDAVIAPAHSGSTKGGRIASLSRVRTNPHPPEIGPRLQTPSVPRNDLKSAARSYRNAAI